VAQLQFDPWWGSYTTYKKYSIYEQDVRAFQVAMRDNHPSHGATPPLPYDPVPYDAFALIIPPSNGNGKAGWWKKVLITSLVILVVRLWMKGAKLAAMTAPLRPMMTTTT
jgi:hypothetical protein